MKGKKGKEFAKERRCSNAKSSSGLVCGGLGEGGQRKVCILLNKKQDFKIQIEACS